MKYAVLSDVHANYPALKAVLDEVEGHVDGYISLGDMIGLMGYPEETVSTLKSKTDYALKGNHDVSVVENNMGHVNSPALSEFELQITNDNLSDENREWIESLNTFEKDNGFVLAHAKPTPEMSSGLEERNTGLGKGHFTKAAGMYDDEVVDFIFVGHTHDQAGLDCSRFGNNVTVINPGTVGMNKPKNVAEYAVIDTENNTYELKSVEFDFGEVESRLNELDVPVHWW